MRIALSIISLILFAFGYWICLFIYPDDVVKFFELRMNIYSCIILSCFYLASLNNSDKRVKLILDIGIGLSLSDVIDRLLFDITTFNANDYVLIVLTLLISIYNYARKKPV